MKTTYVLERYVTLDEICFSPSPRSETAQESKGGKRSRKQIESSSKKQAEKERVSAAGSGDRSWATTFASDDIIRPDTTRRIEEAFARLAISPLNLSRQKSSSSSTRKPQPSCGKCGRVGIRRKGRWDYCPMCDLYQPI